MARDITVHFVGSARDLAASSAVAGASVDRFGNQVAFAGAQAEAASFGFNQLLLPLIGLAAAAVVVTAPITVLATTFGGLAAGVVALAAVTGHLGDVSGQAEASQEELAAAQARVATATEQAAINQAKYNLAVKEYGPHSLQARQALLTLRGSQDSVNAAQEKFTELQARGQGPLAELIEHVKAMADALGAKAAPMALQFLGMLDRMIPVIGQLGSQLIDWFAARLPTMLPIVTQIFQVVAGAVLGFAAAWGRLVDWFMAIWPAYTNAIRAVFDQIGTGVQFALPALGLAQQAFAELGPVIAFIRAHADSLKPVLYAVGALLVVMAASAVLTGASVVLLVAVVVALASALSAAVSWLRDHIPGAIAAAGGAFSALGGWVHGVVAAFWNLVGAAEAAVGAIRHAIDMARNVPVIGGILQAHGLPGFQSGGIVPGPIGAPMLAIVHGGETVVPAGRTFQVNVHGVAMAPSDPSVIVDALRDFEILHG